MQWNNVPEIDYQFSVCVLLEISNESQLVCWYALCNSGISRQTSQLPRTWTSFFLSSTWVCSDFSYTNNYVLSVWLWRFKVHGFFNVFEIQYVIHRSSQLKVIFKWMVNPRNHLKKFCQRLLFPSKVQNSYFKFNTWSTNDLNSYDMKTFIDDSIILWMLTLSIFILIGSWVYLESLLRM